MNSREQFEAWASEHLPTLHLTKTEQGTYESTATGNFFAAWSARDGEIERLSSENGLLRAGNSRLQGELHAGSDLIATYRRVNREIRSDRDQIKAENEALRKIISDSATSCGAAVSVECSLDFMAHLPVEIFSVISKLRKDAEQWRALVERAKNPLSKEAGHD